MKTLDRAAALRLAERLENESQQAVMQDIPAFADATVHAQFGGAAPASGDTLHPLVFNMERGVYLREAVDFLRMCQAVQPFDVILANELDDGCARSGERDTAAELARALGLHYVFGLEFVELADPAVGFHGNAVFSRWPITWAKIVRLPEQYNWYHDRQKRIGGRCAVFAKLNVNGREVGVASIHLENRTDGAGRQAQMRTVLDEAERVFAGMPVILGGDLNTNTFDGRDKTAIERLAAEPALLKRQLAQAAAFEPLLADCGAAGYAWDTASGDGTPTRRKPLPDGAVLQLRLDWILPRGLTVQNSRVVSTLTADCGFAAPDSALAQLKQTELSDHDVVWASLGL